MYPAKPYKTVEVAGGDSTFFVCLDGKPLKTPKRIALSLPSRELAEAIAEEWWGQGASKTPMIDPAAMPFTRLAFAALDMTAQHRRRLADEILAYGRSDLLCYRAEAPLALKMRQAEAWDPLLSWARERLGARLSVGFGIAFLEQPPESERAFAAAIGACDDFALVALRDAASLTGSLVLALALKEGRLDAAEAFALSRLDETFQNETWGSDAEAEARAARLARGLAAVERFLRLARS